MADVFISYSRKDIDFARRLFDALESRGREVWIDWDSIPISAEWWAEIQRGIDGANAFVFVISPESLASPVCALEVADALASNKRIIPVVHREAAFATARESLATVNPTDFLMQVIGERNLVDIIRENWRVLEGINWIFFRESDDFSAGIARLITAIETDLERVRLHTRLYVRAREWTAKDRDESYLLLGSELSEASHWLTGFGDQPPIATEEHRALIRASLDREAREQAERQRQIAELNAASDRADRSRRIALAAGLASVALVVALILAAFFAGEQINSANAQIATATVAQGVALNEQRTAVAQVGTAVIVQRDAEGRADAAGTQVSVAQATLAPIPATLTQAAVVREDAEAEFDIIQALFDTLVNGETNIVRNTRMNELVDLYPDRASAYLARGLVFGYQGASEAALADFNRAIGLQPDRASAYANRGNLLLLDADIEGALENFNRALELEPDEPGFLYWRSYLYIAHGRIDEAIADLERIAVLSPESANPYIGLGLIYETYLQQPELALENYTRAIEIDPSVSDAHYRRGNLHMTLGDLDSARADFEQAVAVEPFSVAARLSAGVIAWLDGDPQAALDAFNLYLLTAPNDTFALYRRGILYGQIGQYDRAVADFNRTLELNPAMFESYRARAFIHVFTEDYQSALEDMNRYLELAPPFARAYIERGLILFELGDSAGALADFDHALEIDPSSSDARQARQFVLSASTPEPSPTGPSTPLPR